MRPVIQPSEFKLRLFLDTNVLIDYVENFDNNKAKSFVNLAKKEAFRSIIELVTSDYVLWEFYGNRRKEHYIRKMVRKKNCSFKRAHRESETFRGADSSHMEDIGHRIQKEIDQLGETVSFESLVGKNPDGFSGIMEKLLQCSKFSYQDTIVLVSAQYTNSHIMVTVDDAFSSEGAHLDDLVQAKHDLSKDFPLLEFKKPDDFCPLTSARKQYENWFKQNTKRKRIGKIINDWRRKNVIAIECLNNHRIEVGDCIYIVKFFGHTIFKYSLPIKNLLDYDTANDVQKGKKVTLRLPSDFPYRDKNWVNGTIYLSG